MQNRDVFLKDPLATSIPNLGVAKIGEPTTPEEWEVLRFELSSFVCEGAYADGLERILSSYLRGMTQPQQPAVWVGGFYGSGKSHLLKVLEYLWSDFRLPDGATARGLATLPTEITALLTELSTLGRREGGLWSAAGTLSAAANTSVRLALLAIFFRAAGLPDAYQRARFVLWLRQQGYEDAVRAALQARGRTLEGELPHMYVSPPLATALAEAVPEFPKDAASVLKLLQTQYPAQTVDISNDDMLAAIQDVLRLQSTTVGKLPCTLVVIDELQQYLGEDVNRVLAVQQAVEACSAKFGGRLLFVASGQSALQAHHALQRLQDRFMVSVALSETDVDRVVRQVVLRKAPDKVASLEAFLDSARGEIDRELAGTKIGPSSADTLAVLAADYPLLPARRRFWERVLRAVDTAGAGGLRTQLKVVHEANQHVALAPLGTVIAADVIYDAQEPSMLQTNVLPRETAVAITTLADGTPEGKLRSRLCKLIFLINKLPTDGPLATGVRPTAAALADLLVDDLRAGDAVRATTPVQLAFLMQEGKILQLGAEYRLQTPEGIEWELDYRKRYATIRNDESRLGSERDTLLRDGLRQALGTLSVAQGVSRTSRRASLHFGADAPTNDTGSVIIWVHDGWAETEAAVREEAQAAGQESPLIHLFLPRLHADAWRDGVPQMAAARECLQQHAPPTTAGGREAQEGMRSRERLAQQSLQDLLKEALEKAAVYLGGGAGVSGDSLPSAVRSAIDSALVRLFPRFAQADLATWDKVFERATQGNADALAATGYSESTEQHPVCKEVRLYLGSTGKKGADIRRHFSAPPFGWPQDAVDAALAALIVGGFVRASRDGKALTVKQLSHPQISGADFASEGFNVTVTQRLAVRGLLQQLGVSARPNEEAFAIPTLLHALRQLAREAGGLPPAPEAPKTDAIDDLARRGGNEQFVAVYEQRDRLAHDFADWSERRDQITARLPAWQQFEALLAQAESLPEAQPLAEQAAAIKKGRQLLADPDPVPPLLTALTGLLRSALQEQKQAYVQARATELTALRATQEWRELAQTDRQRLEEKHGLAAPLDLAVGTTEDLAQTLQRLPLANWPTMSEALPARTVAARKEAASITRPNAETFKMPAATLASRDDVDRYLQKLRAELMALINDHKTVLL